MDRRRALVALLALLAALSLGVGAATLEDVDTGGSGTGSGPDAGPGTGPGSGFDLGAPKPLNNTTGVDVPYLGVLFRVLVVLFVLGALLGVIPLYEEYGLKGILIVVVMGVGCAVLVLFIAGLVELGGGTPPGGGGLFGTDEPSLPGGGNPSTDSGATSLDAPAIALGLLFGLALLAAVAAFVRSTGDDVRVPDPEPVEGTADSRVTALGEAAGAAADRIEGGADVNNEVFRAWREMTDRLEVANPQSTTPAEFARAAVAAGLDGEDVGELTELFEEVRYGDAPATEDRERRAVAALRRIEEAYA